MTGHFHRVAVLLPFYLLVFGECLSTSEAPEMLIGRRQLTLELGNLLSGLKSPVEKHWVEMLCPEVLKMDGSCVKLHEPSGAKCSRFVHVFQLFFINILLIKVMVMLK